MWTLLLNAGLQEWLWWAQVHKKSGTRDWKVDIDGFEHTLNGSNSGIHEFGSRAKFYAFI